MSLLTSMCIHTCWQTLTHKRKISLKNDGKDFLFDVTFLLLSFLPSFSRQSHLVQAAGLQF